MNVPLTIEILKDLNHNRYNTLKSDDGEEIITEGFARLPDMVAGELELLKKRIWLKFKTR